MARIFYGVMGDSRGHLSRSLSMAREMPGHEFLFAGGGRVLELRSLGFRVLELPMVSTALAGNRVAFTSTIGRAAMVLARSRATIRALARAMEDFAPDLALTDYEFFTPRAARLAGISCLSLDHQHVLTRTVHEPPPGQALNRALTRSIIQGLFSASDRYLVSSFFDLPPRLPDTEVLPPIIRQEVLAAGPGRAGHALVYFRGGEPGDLLAALKRRGRRTMVYGLGDAAKDGPLVFRPTSVQGFLDDLSGCEYVISGGGHSLISEALFLGKPVLCLPAGFFYEQYFNAHFLARAGFGALCLDWLDLDQTIEDFEAKIEGFRARIRENEFSGNSIAAKRLSELMAGS
ncbi:MAG: hypothetical protein JW718_02190 [Desulfovibrionaceae bacterium]|nr:hypothetical protein [Desulfovibrionaceae bacterium]